MTPSQSRESPQATPNSPPSVLLAAPAAPPIKSAAWIPIPVMVVEVGLGGGAEAEDSSKGAIARQRVGIQPHEATESGAAIKVA